MTKNNTMVETENSGMFQVYSFAILFVVNALVIYFANLWFPLHVVLGTATISLLWALVLSAGSLALIGILSMPFFHEWEIRRGRILTSMEWMLGYFVLNFVGIWLITRASEIFGLGVTSWVVVLILAFILDVVQGFGMMSLESTRKK